MTRRKGPLAVFTIAIAGAALLGGCATYSSGNNHIAKTNQASLSHDLIKGRTTESQVRSKFGSPTTTSFNSSGQTIWVYKYKKGDMHANWKSFVPFMSGTGGHIHKTKLRLAFNKKGVLQKYSLSHSNSTSSSTGY